MPYEYSEAQKRYLTKHFARKRDMEDCCTCTGDCDDDTCEGFKRNCLCDQTWKGIRGVGKAHQLILKKWQDQ